MSLHCNILEISYVKVGKGVRKIPSQYLEMRPVFFSENIMIVISISPSFTSAHKGDIYDNHK